MRKPIKLQKRTSSILNLVTTSSNPTSRKHILRITEGKTNQALRFSANQHRIALHLHWILVPRFHFSSINNPFVFRAFHRFLPFDVCVTIDIILIWFQTSFDDWNDMIRVSETNSGFSLGFLSFWCFLRVLEMSSAKDLVEEGKKRIVLVLVCVFGLSYLMSCKC